MLYHNNIEAMQFLDVAAASGTDNLGPGSGCAFGDYDNDGDLDLFVVNLVGEDRVYMNLGDGTFVDMATAFGMADTGRAIDVMLGDYDNDGDLDAYVINEIGSNHLYRNGDTAYNWLKVKLRGIESNVDGIGARLQVFADDTAQIREVNAAESFSQSSRTAHFGLGGSSRIDSLTVRWPNGQVDKYLDLVPNAVVQLVEGQGVTAVEEAAAPLPHGFFLEQNYPNPFNASTLIEFSIATPGLVHLVLYNALGQQIRVLVDEQLDAGRHQVMWDGRDEQRRFGGSGTYFYRLESGTQERVRPMVLLR